MVPITKCHGSTEKSVNGPIQVTIPYTYRFFAIRTPPFSKETLCHALRHYIELTETCIWNFILNIIKQLLHDDGDLTLINCCWDALYNNGFIFNFFK